MVKEKMSFSICAAKDDSTWMIVPDFVRIEPAGPATVVDGSADALAGLAAFGALPTRRPLLYAGDRSAAQVRAAAAAGADVVISDSNRRRVFVAGRLTQNTGPTLAAGEHIPRDAAVLDPFADRGAAAQTIAVYQGASYVRAPQSPGFSLFPEHRPFAAFDGSPSTAWLADRALAPGPGTRTSTGPTTTVCACSANRSHT